MSGLYLTWLSLVCLSLQASNSSRNEERSFSRPPGKPWSVRQNVPQAFPDPSESKALDLNPDEAKAENSSQAADYEKSAFPDKQAPGVRTSYGYRGGNNSGYRRGGGGSRGNYQGNAGGNWQQRGSARNAGILSSGNRMGTQGENRGGFRRFRNDRGGFGGYKRDFNSSTPAQG